MSTVTVNLPNDVENELEVFLKRHPEYDDREDLLLAFTRLMLDASESIEDVQETTESLEASDDETVAASKEALELFFEFYGIPRRVSEETIDRIERSREQFKRGEYVSLEEV